MPVLDDRVGLEAELQAQLGLRAPAEVEILSRAEFRIEAAQALEHVTAAAEVRGQKPRQVTVGESRLLCDVSPALGVALEQRPRRGGDHAAAGYADVLVVEQGRRERGQPSPRRRAVAVEVGEQSPSGGVRAGIPRCRGARAPLLDHAHAAFASEVGRPVSRAVVDE